VRHPAVQYAWPPQDPSRLPDPPPPPSNASPFVYGNDGFNPSLRPSNSALRARHRHPHHSQEDEQGDVYSSGSDREKDSSPSRSSSPERYLSDYDEDDWGPMDRSERTGRTRVRQGSEGWEVRPVAGWGVEDDLEGREGRPWEDEGRYNVYDPGLESDGEGE